MGRRYAAFVIPFVLAFVATLALFGCATPGGGQSAGVVASVAVGNPAAKPTVLARYDGNTFCAWGSETYVAEMFVEQTGLPVLLRTGGAGTAIVRVRDPKLEWDGLPGQALPDAARILFRQTEIDGWGLEFQFPPIPHPTEPPAPPQS